MALRNGGYVDEAQARLEGERHRLALYLAGPASGYPVDARDGPGSATSDEIKDKMLKQGVRLLDSPHGLQVFPEDELENRWLTIHATATTRLAPTRFVDAFAETYRLVSESEASESERLALELFNQAHIDSSARAQFMTFTTVVEVLAQPARRSAATRKFLDDCAVRLQDEALEDAEREALRNALGNLHRESITTACEALVAQHLGKECAREFRELYRVRGRLTHRGTQHDNLGDRLAELTKLVAALLRAHFR